MDSTSYTIQDGDSLTKIAFKLGISIAKLKQLNQLGNDDFLYPGRKLLLKEAASMNVEDIDLAMNEDQILEPEFSRKRSNSVAERVKGLVKQKPDVGTTKSGAKDDFSPKKASTQSLKARLRASLNKGGNISDIDKIFEHVLNESK